MATGERPPLNPKARDAVGEQLGRRLDSWKEIASWFERSEKTVRRWEQREGMPVHRLLHEKREPIVIFLIFLLLIDNFRTLADRSGLDRRLPPRRVG
jgi:hypothetical protein